MTIKTIAIASMLAFVWMACNNDTPQQSATPAETAPTTSSDENSQFTLPQEIVPTTAGEPTAATPNLQEAVPAPAGGSGTVNPPHGQPGHVCGKPVGVPLDGSSAAANKPAQTPPPAVKTETKPQPSGSTGNVAPGTNPPHGQPGHVCGTPVGSPLPKQ